MARITLNLPRDLSAKLQARASEAGYDKPQDYVRNLIVADTSPTNTDEELEAYLLKRMEGGESIEATPAFWRSMTQKARAASRARNRKSKSA